MTAFTDIAGIPQKYYGAIFADPPWSFKSRTALQSANWDSRRDAEKHYAVMSLPDIMDLPVKGLASPDGCHLFLCTTSPMIEQSLEVMRAWGFKFSCIAFTWAKTKIPSSKPVDRDDGEQAFADAFRDAFAIDVEAEAAPWKCPVCGLDTRCECGGHDDEEADGDDDE